MSSSQWSQYSVFVKNCQVISYKSNECSLNKKRIPNRRINRSFVDCEYITVKSKNTSYFLYIKRSISSYTLLIYFSQIHKRTILIQYIIQICYHRNLGGIPALVELVKNEIPEVHRAACGCLRNLSYGRSNDENKVRFILLLHFSVTEWNVSQSFDSL